MRYFPLARWTKHPVYDTRLILTQDLILCENCYHLLIINYRSTVDWKWTVSSVWILCKYDKCERMSFESYMESKLIRDEDNCSTLRQRVRLFLQTIWKRYDAWNTSSTYTFTYCTECVPRECITRFCIWSWIENESILSICVCISKLCNRQQSAFSVSSIVKNCITNL